MCICRDRGTLRVLGSAELLGAAVCDLKLSKPLTRQSPSAWLREASGALVTNLRVSKRLTRVSPGVCAAIAALSECLAAISPGLGYTRRFCSNICSTPLRKISNKFYTHDPRMSQVPHSPCHSTDVPNPNTHRHKSYSDSRLSGEKMFTKAL